MPHASLEFQERLVYIRLKGGIHHVPPALCVCVCVWSEGREGWLSRRDIICEGDRGEGGGM